MTPKEIEAERELFEADAEPMDFKLARRDCAAPEPWAEYMSHATGHRWAGWLARASIRPAQAAEPVVLRLVAHLDEDACVLLHGLLQGDGDELSPVTLHVGDGHSGHGLYGSLTAYPDEGTVFLGACAATTPQQAAEERKPLSEERILEIAKNPITAPCSPWWLKDDVLIADVRQAAVVFARAVLAEAGIKGD